MRGGFAVLIDNRGVALRLAWLMRGGLGERARLAGAGLVGAGPGAGMLFIGGGENGVCGENQSPGEQGGRGELG